MLASAYERSGSIEFAEKEFADAMKESKFDPNVGLDLRWVFAAARRHRSCQ